MLDSTVQVIKASLKADPSIQVAERSRLLAMLRTGGQPDESHTSNPRLIRRAEVARRIGVSLRTVDNLARQGILRKRVLPGRQRSSGFLSCDVDTLLLGGKQ